MNIDSKITKCHSGLSRILRFLATLGMTGMLFFFLFTFPAYASHCSDPSTSQSNNQYCEPLLNNSIFEDLPDCQGCIARGEDPQSGCHILRRVCGTGYDCIPDDEETLFQSRQVMRCELSGSGGSISTGAEPAGLTQIENLVQRIIRLSTGLAFVALFVVLLWAGIKFLTSGGDPKALQSAQQTVVWALLGILFLAIAWLVLQLVAAFTGIDALKIFDIRALCGAGGVEFCR